ncbi:MAG: glycosyltransferase [Bacteroidales bacterium]|nr:glycosyltransferase [Bacteroidales bacterium]
MKLILFMPENGSISKSFFNGFINQATTIKIVDYSKIISSRLIKADNKGSYLPYNYRNYIRNRLLVKIQKLYLQVVMEEKPDLIIVYNDQMLTGETVREIKKTGCKVVVYLADSPLFLVRRDHMLKMMLEVDRVFAPDSYWLQQLNIMGITHTSFLIPGYNADQYYKKEVTREEMDELGSDLIFVGSPYQNIWGYKRALFLNSFSQLDIKIYGPQKWERWFFEFPNLEKRCVLSNTRISDETINTMLNCCKIYPVDANPGIINGLHIRIFECISAGILPLVEYRADINRVFDQIELPVITNYLEAPELARYYINNPGITAEKVKKLSGFISRKYSALQGAEQIIHDIF